MKDALLAKLEAYEIDEPVAFPFSARLARENDWSRDHARRVIAEYKRFVWLAARAGHPVTPSEAVDQAWHLHLCYTRSYWEDLCGGILGAPLHHGPTRGGREEGEKFADWYGRTLESYRRHFGEDPPADIWPEVALRFRAGERRMVDASEHWIVPKRALRHALAVGAGLVSASLLVGCTGLLAEVDLGGFVCFALFFFGMVSLIKLANRSGKGGGCSSSCGGSTSSCGSDSGDGGSSGCGSSGCGGGCGGGD
jgi:hypothetical protein